jgi:hypothetical protein
MSHDARPGARSLGYEMARLVRLTRDGSTPHTDASNPTLDWTSELDTMKRRLLKFGLLRVNSDNAGNKSRSVTCGCTSNTSKAKCLRNGRGDCTALSREDGMHSKTQLMPRTSSWCPLANMSTKTCTSAKCPKKSRWVRFRTGMMLEGNAQNWFFNRTWRRDARLWAMRLWIWPWFPPAADSYDNSVKFLNTGRSRSSSRSVDLACDKVNCNDELMLPAHVKANARR